jgi:hypothetical protein
MIRSLCPDRKQWIQYSIQLNHLSEEYVDHLDNLRRLPTSNKVSHFGKSIHIYHYGGCSSLGTLKSQYEINGQVFSWYRWH